ncbi:hypothetical protein [Actinopolymorpha sp. B9G3]|uniref:hypothetical protein n=1 Tax=Actinopolymorpha sp. B9G3 TaxID=3158970 RepID=UPI0032D8B567
MAICFELVVNFGENVEGARAAALADPSPAPVQAGRHRIPVHRTVMNRTPSYIEVSVIPVAVGWGVSLDGTLPRFRLSAAELSEVGIGLYRLLERFNGYLVAKVGWDPESSVDPSELKSDWADELADGTIDGLVLKDALHDELRLGDNYVEFQPGYLWIPYRGEKPSTLTVE